MIKTDASGDVLWSKTYGGPDDDKGYCVAQNVDGGYIIVGSTSSYFGYDSDVLLIETDENGEALWGKIYGGGGNTGDGGSCVEQTTDGGYIITGFTTSYGAGDSGDVWLIKDSGEPPSEKGTLILLLAALLVITALVVRTLILKKKKISPTNLPKDLNQHNSIRC